MKSRSLMPCLAGAMAAMAVVGELPAQERKTREQLVREDLSHFGALDTWIYNDVARGFARAREAGKPLLVVFRCVPCEACAQLDERIVERDPGVQALLDRYVCVRVVHANGMDLGLFQFDYDQSFAAFLMNGDGTIYGRYGTRSHQTRSEDDVSLEGFAEALKAGLEIHAGYPENQSALAGKQPQQAPAYATPEEFPGLAKYGSQLDYEGNVVASCIHCHQVGESLHAVLRDQGEAIPERLLFPYPHPKILGLVMDPKLAATVAGVEAGSPAAESGFRAGDQMLTLAGQPLISLADIQWNLHNADETGELIAEIRREGETLSLSLPLADGWRRHGDISWRATSWALRRMTTGGMKLEDLSDQHRAAKNLGEDALALEAVHVGQYDEHAHAKRQGFVQGDVITAIAGETGRMSESDLLALLVNRPVGERIPVHVLRGEQELEFTLSMQK